MKHYLLSGILFYCFLLPLLSSAQERGTVIGTVQNNSPRKYDSTRAYRGGFAAVRLQGKWGFINTAGVEVIAPQYNIVSDFIEDNAIVFSDHWIMIDTAGRFVKNSYDRQAQRYINASKPQTADTRKIPVINYNNAVKQAAAKPTAVAPCPPNIDFEEGDFNNWYCYTGLVSTVAGVNTMTWFNNFPGVNAPINGRQTMITATTPSAMDPYGNFPINPPDGSGHAIKLGNDMVNDSAEKVRYILTVPANAVDYSISFQYAAVLENPTNGTTHTSDQKPRLIARVINAATNTVVQCADFLYVAAGSIPGFYNSTLDPNVKCKAWTPVFVNLSGYPGQTMYVEFTTADCTLGAHFGYGYLDVGPCSQPVITQYQCTPANSVTFTGPGDFQIYTWYNDDYTTVLGNSNTLTLNPPPPNGVNLHLELIPFNGSTCRDTLDVTVDSPLPTADAGPPQTICPGGSVQIGSAAVTGETYQWSPTTGLSNPNISNPIATASQSMTYVLTVTSSNGCSAKDTTQVLMNPVPFAGFNVNNTNQCISQNSFVFQNTTTLAGGTYTLAWNFGDGATSTGTSPTHVYASPGTYTVTLTATTNNGCSDVTTATVNVLSNPTVVASAATTGQCLSGNSFSFNNGSSASSGPLGYAWTFGDGGTSTAATPNHTYAAAGTYAVQLIVSTPAGCKDSTSFNVTVHPMPVADFTVNNTNQCINQNSFAFQNATSIASGTYSLSWNFGDGGTSTATAPTHVYTNPGTYNVTLTATSSNNCVNVKTIAVNVLPKPNVVSAPATPAQCLAGNSFSFTNGSTASVGPLSYAWSFGDGGTSTLATPTYTYSTAGAYTVKLVVSTPAGCKDSVSYPVTVHPMPLTDFTVNDANQCINQNSFIFQDATSVAGGTYSLSWNFGDGGTATGTNPTHVYTIPGTYTVTLTATSNNNCIATKTRTVNIFPKPTAVSAVINGTQCLRGNSFSFTNNSSASVGPLSFLWSFGDGGTSTQFNATHQYSSAGTFTVKLVAITPDGCKDSVSYPVTVNPMPATDFTVNDANQCIVQNHFVFQNSTTISSGTYSLEWDFGDGSTSIATNTPSHTYANIGSYAVRLIATSNNGCKDTITHTVQVLEKPAVSFGPNNPSQCLGGNSFIFTNNSTASVSPLNYSWDFGDGNSSTLSSPTHHYATAGTYTVKLVVTTPGGCKDSASSVVNVLPAPSAIAGPPHQICPGTTISIGSAGVAGNTYHWSPPTFLSSSQVANPTLTPTQSVTYTLDVTGANGCTATDVTDVIVNPAPATDFTVNNASQCIAQNSFSFQNASNISSGTYTLHWDFGDGGSSNALNPTHVYTTAGTYTVTLTATSDLGCVQTKTKTIDVFEKPTVAFSPNNGAQCVTNNNFVFTNNSTATVSPLSYWWTFGDGGTSTQANPSHQYAAPGSYTVKLVVTTPAGCKDSTTFEVSVTAVPDALFSVPQPTQCATNNSFSFINNTSFAEPLTWSWNFGDNSFSNQQNPTHSYAAPGTYTVTLTATSATGCTDTETHNVTVNAKPSVNFIPSSNAQCLRGNSTVFTNNSSVTPGSLSYSWSFGDGTYSTAVSPTHVYAAAGVYDVRLIATSNSGCIDSMHRTITIRPNPSVSVNISPSPNLCRGSSTTLTASGATTYSWSPSAGLSCSVCPAPVATPMFNMTYVVTGLDNFNCPGTDTVRIRVMQPFRMQARGDSVCRGDSAGLLASGAATYLWTPSTGLNNDHIANPKASPSGTTTYTVVGYDAANCFTDTAHITLTVWPIPTLSLGPDLNLPVGAQQTLTPVVTNGPIVSWLWTPATYLSCNRCENPVVTITRDIDYELTAKNIHGCTVKDLIRIRTFCPNTQVYIPDAFTPDGDGINDIFMIRGKGISTVNYFRIFNRWGELIFEKTNFAPNNPVYGWDGKIRGIKGPPDVFVYTTEVVCDNGGKNIFKGNVTVLR